MLLESGFLLETNVALGALVKSCIGVSVKVMSFQISDHQAAQIALFFSQSFRMLSHVRQQFELVGQLFIALGASASLQFMPFMLEEFVPDHRGLG